MGGADYSLAICTAALAAAEYVRFAIPTRAGSGLDSGFGRARHQKRNLGSNNAAMALPVLFFVYPADIVQLLSARPRWGGPVTGLLFGIGGRVLLGGHPEGVIQPLNASKLPAPAGNGGPPRDYSAIRICARRRRKPAVLDLLAGSRRCAGRTPDEPVTGTPTGWRPAAFSGFRFSGRAGGPIAIVGHRRRAGENDCRGCSAERGPEVHVCLVRLVRRGIAQGQAKGRRFCRSGGAVDHPGLAPHDLRVRLWTLARTFQHSGRAFPVEGWPVAANTLGGWAASAEKGLGPGRRSWSECCSPVGTCARLWSGGEQMSTDVLEPLGNLERCSPGDKFPRRRTAARRCAGLVETGPALPQTRVRR